MAAITYRPAHQRDFAAMLPDLREADCEEWRVASGKTPVEHHRDGSWSIEPESITRVAEDEEGPCLLYGVTQGAIPGYGWVWLIACNRMQRHVMEFHKAWDAEMAILHAPFAHLYTASWMGNPQHHRWLEWVGFKPYGFPLSGQHGGLFQPFIYGA